MDDVNNDSKMLEELELAQQELPPSEYALEDLTQQYVPQVPRRIYNLPNYIFQYLHEIPVGLFYYPNGFVGAPDGFKEQVEHWASNGFPFRPNALSPNRDGYFLFCSILTISNDVHEYFIKNCLICGYPLNNSLQHVFHNIEDPHNCELKHCHVCYQSAPKEQNHYVFVHFRYVEELQVRFGYHGYSLIRVRFLEH